MSALKKIDPASPSASHSGLQLFTVPSTQVAIHRTCVKEILPLSSSNESLWEFRVFSDNQYIDLSKTYLHLRLSVEKKEGNAWVPIEETDHVAPCQNIGSAFVRQLRLSISNNEVYDSTNLNSYLNYIKNELNHTREYKRSVLGASGYYEDDVEQSSPKNAGHLKRQKMCEKGRVFETMSRLEFDLADQPQFLLSNLDLLFTIFPADDRFLLKTYESTDSNQYRLKVHSIKLYIRSVEVQGSVNLAVMKMLQQKTATYATRKLQIRSCYISPGRSEITQNIFSSIVPRRLIVALLKNEAYANSHKLSNFEFCDFGIREITVNANGRTSPLIPFNADFANDQTVVRMFSQMQESFSLGAEFTNGIDLERFRKNWTFFVLPLNSTLEENSEFELLAEGVTMLKLQFNNPTSMGLNMLVIGEFDSLLRISGERLVSSDGPI